MAKTLFKDWHRVSNLQTEQVQIDATRIDSAKVQWRGVDVTRYETATNTGTTSATLPAVPQGSFYSHSASATVTLKNNSSSSTYGFRVYFDTPWYSTYQDVSLAPGAEQTLNFSAPTTTTNYVGQSVTIGYSLLPSDVSATSTVYAKTTGTWTDSTQNPSVSVNGTAVSHTGTLANGAISPEYAVTTFRLGSNTLAHSIAGSNTADFTYTVTYQPKLAPPTLISPASGSQVPRDQVKIELQLPSDILSDATALHVKLEWADNAAFTGAQVFDTRLNQTNWTYWNGSAWVAFPAGGVPQGSKVRHTFTTAPAVGNWYFRATAHDGNDWCFTSSTWLVRVVLAITGQVGLEINGNPYQPIDLEVMESCNGEVSTIAVSVDNATTTQRVTLDTANDFNTYSPTSLVPNYNVTIRTDGRIAISSSGVEVNFANLTYSDAYRVVYNTGDGKTLRVGQTFQVLPRLGGCYIKRVQVCLSGDGTNPATCYVTFWSVVNGKPSQYIQTLGTVTVTSSARTYYAFTFNPPLFVTASTDLAISVTSTYVTNALYPQWWHSGTVYTNGMYWNGSAWVNLTAPMSCILDIETLAAASGQYTSALRLGSGHVKFETVEDKPGTTSIKHYAGVFPEGVSPMSEPTFTRNSIAYKSDGTQVAANTPRFEPGKFAQAVMVEEGTTNLVSNPSFESGMWPEVWNPSGSSSTATLVTGWNGSGNAARITIAREDATFGIISARNMSLSEGVVYTISFRARAIRDQFPVTYMHLMSNSVGNSKLPDISIGTSWQRYAIAYTVPQGKTASDYGLLIAINSGRSDVYANDWIEVDDVQIEAKPYATSFIGGTRAAETLTIPTAGVLNPQEGTVECWVKIEPDYAVRQARTFIFSHGPDSTTNAFDLIYSGKDGTYGTFYFRNCYSGGNYQARWRPSSSLVGWNYIACTWKDGVGMKLYVNGQLVASTAYSTAWTLESTMAIGVQSRGASGWCNTLIDDLRISSRARTDQEIAAAYQSGQPLPVDEWTTYKACFDGNLWTGNWSAVSSGSIVATPAAGTIYVRSILTAADNQTPAIDKETFTYQAPSAVPGGAVTELAYQSNVDAGIRDYAGTLKLYRGRLWKKEPQGFRLRLLASNGDQILLDRFISANYASQDLGTTLRSIVSTDCAPLVNTDIPATLGYVAPLSLQGERAMKAFDEVRKRFGVLFWVYWNGTQWIVKCIKESDLAAPQYAIVWGDTPVPATLKVLRMHDEPRVEKRPFDATKVTVRVRNSSPVIQATAELSGIPTDQKVEALIEIDSGTVTECQAVANAWLAVHGREQECMICRVDPICSLSFDRQVWVAYPAAGINRAMAVQRIVHRPLASPPHTEVTLGDFVPGDEEILARLLEGVKT